MHTSEFTGGEFYVHDNTGKRQSREKQLKNLNSQISKAGSLHTKNTTEIDLNSFRPTDALQSERESQHLQAIKIEDNMKNTPPKIIERKLPPKVIKKVQTHRLIS